MTRTAAFVEGNEADQPRWARLDVGGVGSSGIDEDDELPLQQLGVSAAPRPRVRRSGFSTAPGGKPNSNPRLG